MERKVKPDTADDPFGDAPIDLDCETAFCERLSSESPSIQLLGVAEVHRVALVVVYAADSSVEDEVMVLKRSWQGRVSDPGQLLTASYSLETLMAVEFSSDISLEQLADEIAKAMGERDPRTVKSIVRACGIDKAIALFEEMRKVESTGGMMTENGQRRRTPGGVFISLFKLDADVPEDVKKKVFDETKQETRKMLRARRKGRNNFATDVAKLAELMKKEKEKSTGDEAAGEDSQSLKPLPSVEEVVLQKQASEAIMVECDSDEARPKAGVRRRNAVIGRELFKDRS
ncbi:hypothetical protein OSTOST_19491 [Ostertagia ostertagi]